MLHIVGRSCLISFYMRASKAKNAREQGVRFLAVDYSQDSQQCLSFLRDHEGIEIVNVIGALVAVLGTVEKLFIVRNTDEISALELEQWRETLRRRVKENFEISKQCWDYFEGGGYRLQDKFRIPEVIVARKRSELLSLAEG